MLHLPSYDLGLAAGMVARELGHPRPTKHEEIPALLRTLEASETLKLFFPSSYVEGFVTAYDRDAANFITT